MINVIIQVNTIRSDQKGGRANLQSSRSEGARPTLSKSFPLCKRTQEVGFACDCYYPVIRNMTQLENKVKDTFIMENYIISMWGFHQNCDLALTRQCLLHTGCPDSK